MDWHAAIKPARVGVSIDVEVVPGSSESLFPVGYNAWRMRLEAKVKAPPQDGAANAELCALAAEVLGVPPAALSVSSGEKSRKKTLLARGLTVEQARARLAEYFA
ncbi:MAG TPA: DUF167 domain-containing protein [Candidatus Thermoplasmatota archaeon]|nr:DUF167 domain-containing protein [Candidatus Thermoplasmatota archaeon]